MIYSSNHQHPGKLFVTQYGQVTEEKDVLEYAEFLRRETGLTDEPPIDLAIIFQRFGITSKRIPLPVASGLLLDPDSGIIFVDSDDLATRQRFTEAHELMEMLFSVRSRSADRSTRGLFLESAKERLCDKGAAELLMPLSTFRTYVNDWDVSLETGKRLANIYEVSLTAALLRTVQFGPGHHALVVWRLAHKPSEEKVSPDPKQPALFEGYERQPPPKKLRVHWGCSTGNRIHIPQHKSIEAETSIYRVYEQGGVIKNRDWLDLGTVCGYCFCESMLVNIDNEKCVLSVIHLPSDEHSMSSC